MNHYCKICARMPIHLINKAIGEAKEKLAGEKVDKSDVKSKARLLKAVIKDLALRVNIDLE
jgi:hypothetical protein